MELLNLIIDNYIVILSVLTSLSVGFVAFTKLTKNKRDDKWAAKFVEILNKLKKMVLPSGKK